jgi:hypothetical protein
VSWLDLLIIYKVCPSFTTIDETSFLGKIGFAYIVVASAKEVLKPSTIKPKIRFVFMFVLNGAMVKMVTLSAQIPVIFDESGKNVILFSVIRKKCLNNSTWIGF